MAQKKYANLSTLSALVDNIKNLFATKSDLNTGLSGKADTGHKHSISDTTNLQSTLDGKVPTTRTINNKPLSANITLSASDVGAAPSSVQTNLNTVSDTLNAHTENDDIHFSATERTKLSGIAAGAQVNTITGVKGNSESSYRNGNVNITKANIGLGNVDNTSDANKPISTTQQLAFDEVNDAIDTHTENTDIHVTTADKTNWNSAYTHSTSAHARTDATKVEDSTTNGNIKINGTETNVYSHPNSGVTAGTYKSVTVNAQGHVTGGSNPTTLAGFGITDGALKSDVTNHNTSTSAHNDIRDLITGLTTRLNTLANSDDTTLDQMSEIVAYIKANKALIDSVTTSKVNVADIVNNLTTNVTNKPLSAAQGVAIKALIDALQSEVDTKVTAVSGKGLSTNDYTTTEKNKLSGIASGAQVNQNAFSNIKVGTTTIAADTTTDTLTLAGTNVTITPDATNDKVTIAVADGTTSAKGVVQLTDSVTSTSTTTAATPKNVKAAYDLANTAKTTADGKANASHTHTVANITDLTVSASELNYMDGVTSNVQAQLDGKASGTHNHSASDITSGTLNAARLPEASETAKGAVTTSSQTFAGSKTFTGSVSVKNLNAGESTSSIGNSLNPFDSAYVNTLNVGTILNSGSVLNGGSFKLTTSGTTTRDGVTTLTVGNSVASGNNGNAQGTIEVYNEGTGSAIIRTGHDDNRNIYIYLPENGGTLITSDDLSGYAKSTHNHSASNITSGILPIARGGTGNSNGYVQVGALSGSTVGALATAEGRNTTASGSYSHAEGNYTEATGSSSHAEGQNTTASNTAAHAEGENTTASGAYSHAEGENTIASAKHQHVQGKFNKEDSAGTYAHIVGNGTGASTSSRSNAHTLDWSGNAWFAGDIYVGGISQTDSDASKVITEADQKWSLIYDSGEISAIANSIAGINVSGYTKFRIAVRCYNDGDSLGDRSGSVIFKAQNGKSYQFPVWTNMFSKSISTVSAMADFEVTDDWLVCPHASRLVGEIDIFTETEGGTANNLTYTGSSIMKCTSPLSTLTISNLDQNSKYYFGIYSRVMVWGCK